MGPILLVLLMAFLVLGHSSANAQVISEREVDQPAPANSQLYVPMVADVSQLSSSKDPAYAPGEVLVGIRRGAVSAASVLDGENAQSLGLFDAPSGLAQDVGEHSIQPEAIGEGIEAFVVATETGEERLTIERLKLNPAVAFAEPNWVVYAADSDVTDNSASVELELPVTLNDPFYADEQWYLQRIRASRAWAKSGQLYAQAADDGIIQVAIVDSGIDLDHPDLQSTVSLQFKNYINPGQLPTDDCGHGTHIAGVVGAGINNRTGIAGMANDVKVVAYKALSLDGEQKCTGFVSDIARAIRDAADLENEIINLSVELGTESTLLATAVAHADNQGSLMIASAGNCLGSFCPKPVQYPARYSPVLAVAATGYDNDRTVYSSVGPEMDIAAPGGTDANRILSTWSSDAAAVCPAPLIVSAGASYCEDVGTSMAAGVVSGVAALVWSVRPELTADQVADILISTVQPLSEAQALVGAGLVDADRAVRYALRSQLLVEPRVLSYSLPLQSPTVETTLLLENNSLEPIQWAITGTLGTRWIDAVGPVTGTVRYGEPSHIPLVISATHMISGSYQSSLTVLGERVNGSKLIVPVIAELTVFTPTVTQNVYLPQVRPPSDEPVWPFVPYEWETPDMVTQGAMERVVRQVSQNSSIGITMPVTITVGSRQYTDARLYANGRVAVPATALAPEATDNCQPRAGDYGLLINGWHADLSPGSFGGKISTFQAASDRFVIEYDNVLVTGDPLRRRVSFQIVLYASGQVGLNYRRMPGYHPGEDEVNISVLSRDGLFYNQITCITDETEEGEPVHSFQSLLIRQGDLY